MRFTLVFCLSFLLSFSLLQAQRGYSFTLGVGGGYYYGDLSAGFSNIFLKPSFSIAYGYYFTPALSLRIGLAHTTIGSADSLAGSGGRKMRDLHFRNSITEVSGILYYEFLSDKRFGYYYFNKPHITPYIFAGVAVFAHNPRAKYNGEWTKLQPLGTEGQFLSSGDNPEPYAFMQIAIPFGGGLSYRFSSNVAIGIELGYRKLFTDYLDDVSTNYPDFGQLEETSGSIAVSLSDPSGKARPGDQRGSPGSKDSYILGMVTFTFYLDKDGNL